MSNFGVSYSCYTEKDAVKFSIETLRKVYPECPVYIVSDGGSDYSFLEKEFDNLKASHEEDMRGWCQRKKPEQNTYNEFERIYKTAMSWLDRNKAAVDYCKRPYMLMMEPDVLVRGKFQIPPGTKLLGPKIVNFSNSDSCDRHSEWVNTLKKIPGAVECPGWSWPLVYETDAFLRVYDFVKQNDEIFRKFIEGDWAFGTAGDITIPVLFAACGYTLEQTNEMIDCNWETNWRETNHPILHAFRTMYPKSDYNGRHAGEKF